MKPLATESAPDPLISVVMPSFNHARFLRAAIDSVLTQDYPSVELLVYDGGSTDDSPKILQYYATEHPGKIWYVSQKDRGQSDAINRGLKRATGDILCWLNSDDILMPGALRCVAQTFQNQPQAQFVYGMGWTIDEAGNTLGDAGVLPFDAWKLVHQRNFIQQPSCFFRRSLFERTGPINENLHYVMDWDLWIRFAAFNAAFVDEYLSGNREYHSNKTQSGGLKRWREIRDMIRCYSEQPWPPSLRLYLIEALCQITRRYRLTYPLSAVLGVWFGRKMQAEMSGRFADGGVEQRFHLSVGNPDRLPSLRLSFTPLSRYDASLRGNGSHTVHWSSSADQTGQFKLKENGCPQSISLPLVPDHPGVFTHFQFTFDTPPRHIPASSDLPDRKICAFLDQAAPCPDPVTLRVTLPEIPQPIVTSVVDHAGDRLLQ